MGVQSCKKMGTGVGAPAPDSLGSRRGRQGPRRPAAREPVQADGVTASGPAAHVSPRILPRDAWYPGPKNSFHPACARRGSRHPAVPGVAVVVFQGWGTLQPEEGPPEPEAGDHCGVPGGMNKSRTKFVRGSDGREWESSGRGSGARTEDTSNASRSPRVFRFRGSAPSSQAPRRPRWSGAGFGLSRASARAPRLRGSLGMLQSREAFWGTREGALDPYGAQERP